MRKTWPPDQQIRTLEELFVAVGCNDREGLEDYIESFIDDVGPLDWEWSSEEEPVAAVVSNGFIGAVAIELDPPMTMAYVNSAVAELCRRIELRSEAAHLPNETIDDQESGDSRTSAALAEFFGVSLRQFAESVGGGWYPISGKGLTGVGHDPIRWFGAGDPLQVVLGVGEEYVTLARPVVTAGGLAGPPELSLEDVLDVDLREGADTLTILGSALPEILRISRSGWTFCRGCLGFGPVHASYCPRCEFVYLGVIRD